MPQGIGLSETVDPRDGLRYRYTAGLKEYGSAEDIARNNLAGREPPAYTFQFKVDRVPIHGFSARYGITWDDISTRRGSGALDRWRIVEGNRPANKRSASRTHRLHGGSRAG